MSEKTGGELPFQIGCCPKCGCNAVANQALQEIIERTRNFESAQQTKSDQRRGEFIELRVAKAIPSDVGHGRVRLPPDTMSHLGLKPGDTVCIQGATGPLASRGRTSAIVWRARPEDSNIGVARFDGVVRKNAKVGLGQKVRIRKVNPVPCTKLVLSPVMAKQQKVRFGRGIEGFAKRGLNKRPVVAGDRIFIPGMTLFAEALPFAIVQTSPRGIVQVLPDTEIVIKEDAVDQEEENMVQNWCCKDSSRPPESKSGGPDRCALQGEGDMGPDIEALGLVLSGLIHFIARMISKSDHSDSNPREKRMHRGE